MYIVTFLKNLFSKKTEPVAERENYPEELQYTERSTDLNEILFGLNLYAHNKAEVDYSTLCLSTVDVWLDRVESSAQYSAKQNVAITSVLKGRRLLRAAHLSIFKGYLPEAEILGRSMFEMQLVLSYILCDSTDGRVNKYLTFEKRKVWDFRTLCNELLGEEGYEIYIKLSQYPHPFNMGREKLIHNGQLQPSAIHDYEGAGRLLVQLGDAAVSLCEKSNVLFDADSKWEKMHQEVYDSDIFKKNFKVVQELIKNENALLSKVLLRSEEARKNHEKN
jgi:hypothetical protein